MVLGSGFKPLIHSLQIFTECSIYSSYKSVHITGKLCPHTVYILQVEQEVKKITVVTNCTKLRNTLVRERERKRVCVCVHRMCLGGPFMKGLTLEPLSEKRKQS